MKDSFCIYRSVFDALMAYPAEYTKATLKLIGEYAMDGTLPEETEGIAYGLFCSVKPLIDNSLKKSAARAAAGKAGGEANNKQTEANVKQNEANDKQTEAYKGEIRKEKEEKRNIEPIMSDKPAAEYPYKAIVDYLNQKAGTAFKDKSKDTRRLIKARIDEGFTLDDFRKVIDGRVSEWRTDAHMSQYLRPQTLFGTKFESYLNAKPTKPKRANGVNFTGREYDFDSLEKQLLNAQRGVAS